MIYEPEEDSFLISDFLGKYLSKNKNDNFSFFEMGSGSGINLKKAFESGLEKSQIFSADINPEAVIHCREIGFNCIESNLFESVQKNKFDLIVFNPPYLPEDEDEPEESRTETTGGKKGNEIIIKFLEKSKNYLKENGKILLITSSLAEKINFEKLGYESKEVSSKKLFFEKLSLWELKLK